MSSPPGFLSLTADAKRGGYAVIPLWQHSAMLMYARRYSDARWLAYPCTDMLFPRCPGTCRPAAPKKTTERKTIAVNKTEKDVPRPAGKMSPAEDSPSEETGREQEACRAPAPGQEDSCLERNAVSAGQQAENLEPRVQTAAVPSAGPEKRSPVSVQPVTPVCDAGETPSPEEQLRAAEARLADMKQQLREAEEKWLLRERQTLLTSALQRQLTPACGRELAGELSRLMCAGADLLPDAGAEAEAGKSAVWSPAPLVESLLAAWPACFSGRAPLEGLEPVTPPLPAASEEPGELSDREYYDRLYKTSG